MWCAHKALSVRVASSPPKTVMEKSITVFFFPYLLIKKPHGVVGPVRLFSFHVDLTGCFGFVFPQQLVDQRCHAVHHTMGRGFQFRTPFFTAYPEKARIICTSLQLSPTVTACSCGTCSASKK